jgi:heme-degrading monooxygenase HmoA
MFMRLVRVNLRPDTASRVPRLYAERIIKPLEKTPGCIYAGLIRSVSSPDEAVSMTLWDSLENAEAYEKSGLFQALMNEAEPYITSSSEWKIQLSEDLTLEYTPVCEEPLVESYNVALSSGEGPPASAPGAPMYVRIMSMKLQPGKSGEFENIYNTEILPALRDVGGCRYAFLTQGSENEVISVTIWSSRESADAYETGGRFNELLKKVRPTLSKLSQWKMAVGTRSALEVHTSDDVQVSGYNVVRGESFR